MKQFLGMAASAVLLVVCVETQAATLLSAETETTAYDFNLRPQIQPKNEDIETSSDPSLDGFVDASSLSEGTTDGATRETTSAAASVDYASGAMRAYAETDVFANEISGNQGLAVATAEFFDEVTFTFNPLASLVTFIWAADWIIDSPATATQAGVVTNYQIRDTVGGFGNTLVNISETYNSTGSAMHTSTIDLATLGSDTSAVLRLDFSLIARARNVGVISGSDTIQYGSLADSSSTSFFNIITSEGMTFSGGDASLLTRAPDLAPVPLPAAGWVLLSGLGVLVGIRRRRAA